MLTIIGCGNLNRCDDGVGVIVAQRLQQFLHTHPNVEVRVFDAGTGGLDVMFQARGSTALMIIDASSTGSEPGAVFKVPGKELESLPELSYTLHDFRWDHALAAGRKFFQQDFPKQVTVYLIEAERLEFGVELSASVERAARIVFAEIIELLKRRMS